MKKLISIVVSLYNEEGNIEKLYSELLPVFKKCYDVDFEILLVNDGSKDSTLLKCKQVILEDARFKIVNLFRNFGHEIAMTAGLNYAKGDAVIFMDGDLQHPPHLIYDMVSKFLEGHDVVLTQSFANEDTSLNFSHQKGLAGRVIIILCSL